MSPARMLTLVARAEVVTWALLLTGMFLKYVTRTTELGVRVFGLAHGVVFLAYVLVVLALHVNQRWRPATLLLALVAGVVPFATIWFERRAEQHALVEGPWRADEADSGSLAQRLLGWAIRRPVLALALGGVAVAAATGILLWIGPPTPPSRG